MNWKQTRGEAESEIDVVVGQLEAVIVAQLLILRAHVGDLAQLERQPQRVERRAPHLPGGKRLAEHGERIGFVLRVAGALIGDIGRRRGALPEEGLFARGLRPDLEDGAGEPQPVAAVFGGGGGDLAQDLKTRAEVVAPEGGIGIAAQGGRRFGNRPRLALDLGLQLDRGISEVVALEGLIRGER